MNETRTPRQVDNNVTEIDLVELLLIYLDNWVWIMIAVILGATIFGVYTISMIPDRFTAVSRMYMVSSSTDSVVDLTDLNIGTSISSDYVELMKTRPIIEGVIDSLHLDYSYEDLLSMCSFSVVPDTRIIKISVTSTDPEEARDISNEIALKTEEQLPVLMDAPKPNIVEHAIMPQRKSSPSLSKNMVIGGLLGLIIMLAYFTIRHLMDDTVKTAEDVEKEFGVMPLSVIPEGEVEGFAEDDDPVKKSRFRWLRSLVNKKKRRG
jgi:capsular polysaccharide biosynthesis protein